MAGQYPNTLVEPSSRENRAPTTLPGQATTRLGDTDRKSPVGKRINLNLEPDEANLVANIRILFQRARAHRRPLVERWKRNNRMLRNRYWVAGRPQWMPAPQVPEIFPIIDSIVGWQTDQKIKHTIAPAAIPNGVFHPFFSDMGRDLGAVMDSGWHVNNEEQEVSIGLFDAQMYGIAVFKTVWDMTLAGGLGDATIKRLDPFGFYPDPAGTNMNTCNYFIEARDMSVQSLDRQFPGSRLLFKGGGGYVESIDVAPDQMDNERGGSFPKANPGALGEATAPRYGRPGAVSQVADYNLEDVPVTVFECWFREHTIYKGPSGEDRVLDTWRVIVVAGNRILLNCPATDIWDHGQHPYSRYAPNDIGEFFGISMVELLIPTQESINRLLAAMQHNVELSGNPIWKEHEGTNLQRTPMTNKPGGRYTFNNAMGKDAGWAPPPTLHQAMPELLRFMLQRMEAVSGLSAITKGGSPAGRNAQGVIDAMQEAAFVRIRRQMRAFEVTMRDTGYKKASLIIQNYTQQRLLAIIGPDGEENVKYLKARHFYIPSSNGDIPMKFQLLVDAGSGRHTSRKVREDQAIMLFRVGAIDERALLEAMDFPNFKEVADRVAQMKASGALKPPGQRADR